MTMNRGGMVNRPPSQAELALSPQAWIEWAWSVYNPDQYIIQWQGYGVTIAATLAAVTTGNIQVPQPFYCFGWRSSSFVTATGAKPTVPYRIGIANAANNDWTNGQWLAPITSGDNLAAAMFFQDWISPREVSQNEVLTVTVANNLANAVTISVDTVLWGYEVRQRNQPITRG